jgi:ElaB/YqjD/DUF883 family membrane-anchored ribosome-binding protein
MKTPMQELLKLESDLTRMFDSDERVAMAILEHIRNNKKAMLDKERERLCDAYIKGGDAQYQYIIEGSFPYNTAEDWYNETFKTKER